MLSVLQSKSLYTPTQPFKIFALSRYVKTVTHAYLVSSAELSAFNKTHNVDIQQSALQSS